MALSLHGQRLCPSPTEYKQYGIENHGRKQKLAEVPSQLAGTRVYKLGVDI